MLQTGTICQVSSLKAISFVNPLRSSLKEVIMMTTMMTAMTMTTMMMTTTMMTCSTEDYIVLVFYKGLQCKSLHKGDYNGNLLLQRITINPLRSWPREVLRTGTICQVSSLKANSFVNPLRSSPKEVLQTSTICQDSTLRGFPL